MAVEEVVNISAETLSQIVIEVGKVGLWLQAIGILTAIWLISIIVTFILNRKKRKTLYSIKEDLIRIETKIDKINKKLPQKNLK